MNQLQPVNALLLTLPSCAVCPQIRKLLKQLQQEQLIAKLQEFSLAEHPELAETHQVRNLPWYRIGEYEFSGLQTLHELRDWALRASNHEDDLSHYLEQLIQQGDLDQLEKQVAKYHSARQILWQWLLDPDTELQTRLALSVVTEALLSQQDWLEASRSSLYQLASPPNLRLATDGCFYLSLTNDEACHALLQQLADSDQAEHAAIAREVLEDE